MIRHPMLKNILMAGLLPCLLAGCATSTDPGSIRRIVTVETPEGNVQVLADGMPSNVHTLNGSRIVRLWETGELPVPLDIADDRGATAGNAYRPGFIGSSFYIADIPPGSDLGNIPMHKQDSLDYIAVMDGEIELVLEDGSLVMGQGDILVQAGNLHSWVNSSDQYCRLLVVVLTATRGGP
ncbi:MAG: cupin domain-containing protein [Xanthomonadales bacterium]|nr:cupin domain-containing protein [Xanthomonadales bacterium]